MSRVRLVAALCAAALLLAVPSTAGSGSGTIVVSQIFGGGGNAGAPYAADFIELFNPTPAAVDVNGWSVQYATAAGNSWQATTLTGTIQAGRHYLVQLAGGAIGAPLPAPDASGATNLSATNGKIALVREAVPLTCGATAGSCAANALVADLVGFGTASDYEGAGAAPALTSLTAALRGDEGCADSDSNSADFSAGAPAPRNSSSTAHACVTPPPSAPSASQSATVEVEVQPVLSVSLERAALSFGSTTAGASPAPLPERVTVLSNHPAGYALTVQRSAFTPADLPLAIQASPASGGVLGPALVGGAFTAVPVGPSTLTIGTRASISTGDGDVWSTNLGFAGPFPSVAPGRYAATVTFTVLGR
jgi:lamin tail-like protein